MWDALRPILSNLGLDPIRVENGLGAGFPDVNYSDGMLELKRLDHWPVRASTPVSIPTLEERPAQVAVMARRWCHGGCAFLMLRVGQELLLFDGWTARTVRGAMPRAWLYENACWVSVPGHSANYPLLKLWLRRDGVDMEGGARARLHRLGTRTNVEVIARQLQCSPTALIEAEMIGGPLLDDLLGYWEN